MVFRKFGRSDGKVEVDSKDEQGISKSAAADQQWTAEDQKQLVEETNEK